MDLPLKLRGRLSALLGRFDGLEAVQAQRSRLFLSIAGLCLPVGALTMVNMAVAGSYAQVAGMGALLTVIAGLTAAFIRGKLPLAPLSHGVLGLILAMVFWVAWEGGGIQSGVAGTYLIVAPIMALGLLGPRGMALWTGVVCVAVVALVLRAVLPGMPEPSLAMGSPVRAGVAMIILQGFVLGLSWMQHRINVRQREDLERSRLAAQESSEAKSAFLANMSHELRTPMNGVLGLTQVMLEEGDLSAQQRHTLESILSSGQSLVGLLNDLLDLSKIEAGRLEFEDIDYAPQAVAQEVCELLRGAAESKGLELRLEAKDTGWVVGDPTRFRQVLLNLVGNAVKFTPKGWVALRVERSGDLLRVEVQDTGIGITPAAQEQLFQPFTQADSSTARRFGGTGLGLAISRRLVSLMGGDIGVRSTPDVGSSFFFELEVAAGQPPKSPSSTSELGTLPPGVRVLVAEDNPVNQMVARRMLTRMGVEPVVVPDGEQALKMVEEHPWDMVLMDAHMPVMDGLEATRRIRARGFTLRIVAMTAGTMAEDRQACFDAGMDAFIAKPVRAQDLLRTLQSMLEPKAAA